MDKKRRLPDGGQAAEEIKVQPCGDKSAGGRGRHAAGGRSLMLCRRVGQRTLARTASAATRSRTNNPANIQSKNITGSSFRLFLEPRFPGSGWPTCFLPPMNEGKRGFEGQKFAHTAGPLDHTASMVKGLSFKTAKHLPAMGFRVFFEMQVGQRPPR